MNNFTQLVRLGRDAETKYTQGGKPITSFSVAYDTGYGDNKKTSWLECSAFGERWTKLELLKGSQIVICGEVYGDKWTDKNGAEKLTMKLNVSDFQYAGAKASGDTPKPSSNGAPPKSDSFPEDDIEF